MSKTTLQSQITALRKDLGKVRKSLQTSMQIEKIVAVIEIALAILITIGPQAGDAWRLLISSLKNYLI
jgi:hypothetical protein